MTAPRDEKYIVFKRSDWERLEETFGPDHEPIPYVQDAVVIRRQDVFAPPALDAYANSINVALTILPGVHPDLQAVADYFHAQAVASWETARGLPD